MEQVKYILDLNDLEGSIKELKMSLHGDNLSKHKVIEIEGHTVIKMWLGNEDASSVEMFYGKKHKDCLYIGRYQYIQGIESDEINLYDEFFCNGTVLVG